MWAIYVYSYGIPRILAGILTARIADSCPPIFAMEVLSGIPTATTWYASLLPLGPWGMIAAG